MPESADKVQHTGICPRGFPKKIASSLKILKTDDQQPSYATTLMEGKGSLCNKACYQHTAFSQWQQPETRSGQELLSKVFRSHKLMTPPDPGSLFQHHFLTS
jgi:hypothetical protein